MLALLDRFCEERMIVDELNQEVKSGNKKFPSLATEAIGGKKSEDGT